MVRVRVTMGGCLAVGLEVRGLLLAVVRARGGAVPLVAAGMPIHRFIKQLEEKHSCAKEYGIEFGDHKLVEQNMPKTHCG